MNRIKKILALTLALVLLLALTACGKEEEAVAETASKYIDAVPGGDIDISGVEALDTSVRMDCVAQEGTLYVSYNNIQNKSTQYFQPAGESIEVVIRTQSDAPVIPTFRLSLWMLNDEGKAQYVDGCMSLVDADNSCYTCNFSGLSAESRYKLTIGYATSQYYLSGLMKVTPLASESLTSVEG